MNVQMILYSLLCTLEYILLIFLQDVAKPCPLSPLVLEPYPPDNIHSENIYGEYPGTIPNNNFSHDNINRAIPSDRVRVRVMVGVTVRIWFGFRVRIKG